MRIAGKKSCQLLKMTNPTILEELLKLAATANSLAEFKQSLAKINI
jgi:hypothetical protein